MNRDTRRDPLPPGATLGVFGGGQLGRMFAQAAARMGYRVHVFAPDEESPAGEVAARLTRAGYADLEAVARFARSVDAVTYEFENVLAECVEEAHRHAPVRPHPRVLAVTRNRLTEKGFLKEQGIPVTPFQPARSPRELEELLDTLGGRAVVKTTALGYDGKGQTLVTSPADAARAWEHIGSPSEAIVEAFIDFQGECSMLVARGHGGGTVFYGPFYNDHADHILDVTTWEAGDASPVAAEARAICGRVADALELDGMVCVEFFITRDGLLINEIAPRPHNSGHLTIEACSVSQFEQQALLTAGHAPVAPQPRAPAAAMVNLLGGLWSNGEPPWHRVLADPEVALHLYGKSTPRPGRKMGHLTVLADSRVEAETHARAARDALAEET